MLTKGDIKKALIEKNLYAYEVAAYMHITEAAFSKRLRCLTKKSAEEIMKAIKEMPKKAAC